MFCCTKDLTQNCKVILLDDQEFTLEIKKSSLGQEVLDAVFRHLNLLETSYFGLRYKDKDNQTQWLNSSKRITKQIKGNHHCTLYFGVKFYDPDPCKLIDETTRYQYFLQLKQDVLQGRLPVSFNLAAELGAYSVQSELGDYDPRRHTPGYVSEFRFISNQTAQLEGKIEELHKELIGYLPSMAELQYLEKVKWLEMYGVDLHPVLGEDNVEYFLGLTPTGIILIRNKNKVASYPWSSISKMTQKRKYFMLRVGDKNTEQNTYGFETPTESACKHLYKCCIEQNAFFRVSHNTASSLQNVSISNEQDRNTDGKFKLKNEASVIRSSSKRYQRRTTVSTNSNFSSNLPVMKENFIQKKNSPYALPPARPVVGGGWSSPRSVRSAPPLRGLFSSSPRSVHSSRHRRTPSNRSASIDSRSSDDSRNYFKQRSTNRRQVSDNESEGSAKSRRRRNRSRRLSASSRSHHHNSRYERKEKKKPPVDNPGGNESAVTGDMKSKSVRKHKDAQVDIKENNVDSMKEKFQPRERNPNVDPSTRYKPFIRYVQHEEELPVRDLPHRIHGKPSEERRHKYKHKESKNNYSPRQNSPQRHSSHKHRKVHGSSSDISKKKEITKKKKITQEMSTEL